ncbi:TRAP transporter large permease subunit [Chloroflexota bacterium]
MSPELATIIIFGSLLLLLALGVPMAFALGGVATISALVFLGPKSLAVFPQIVWTTMNSFVVLAVPIFIFMAILLERSGIAEELYEAMHQWMGPINGGLAMGTVLICTLFAAMSGVSAAATVTMGLIAVPAMLKRSYNRSIVLGSICAGGALGVLIPPSILMVLIGELGSISVGKLFIGGIVPGLILSTLFIVYIGIRCLLRPNLGPAISSSEAISWKKKFVGLRAVILPVMIVIAVLGTIFFGIASVTEAAAVGAAGAVLSAIIHRKFNWSTFKESCYITLRQSSMILWIVLAASLFNVIYTATGSSAFIHEFIVGTSNNVWITIALIQLVLIFFGCFLEPVGIILITVPILHPIIQSLGFDPVWFGVLIIVNLQLGYLTPPFGVNLFFLKSVAPDYITMSDIYRSVAPFLICQLIGLIIVIVFPMTVTWLPDLMMKYY